MLSRARIEVSLVRAAQVCVLLAILMCAACKRMDGLSSGLESRHVGQPVSQPQSRFAPLTYVALGDSTGVGLGARNGGGYVERLFAKMRHAQPQGQLVNLSVVNATASDVLHKQMPRLAGSSPTIITLGIGANDVMAGVDEESFGKAYEEILASVQKTGATIVVMTIPNLTMAPALAGIKREELAKRVEKFNRRIEGAATRDHILLVDLYHNGDKEIEPVSRFFSSDGLHPSDEGYAYWTEMIWSKIEKTIVKQ